MVKLAATRVLKENLMDRTDSLTGQNVPHKHVHSPHDNPSILMSSLYGMAITTALFVPLGLFIGFDRAPGAFYQYGLSCFIWPVVGMMALGSVVGGSLGYVFGAIAHCMDDPELVAADKAAAKISTQSKGSGRLTLHLPRH